jgi:cytochrome c oxidase subunit 2
MRILVIGERPQAFRSWLQQQSSPAMQPSGEQAVRGARLFQERTCSSCHTITGTAADGTLGPDLTHLASRRTLASGVLENTPQDLARWIADPQGIKPGCAMPDLDLEDDQVAELVAYLKKLK